MKIKDMQPRAEGHEADTGGRIWQDCRILGQSVHGRKPHRKVSLEGFEWNSSSATESPVFSTLKHTSLGVLIYSLPSFTLGITAMDILEVPHNRLPL